MNCFNHHERPALGMCKSCGKGLCEECLQEVPNGLACKSNAICAERVAIINKSIDNYQIAFSTSKKVIGASGMFSALAGSFFLLVGIFSCFFEAGIFGFFLVVLGGLFMFHGLYSWFRSRKMPS